MRNRRLLTLAVLAVAIGFPAYAQAVDPYGIAVVTLIQNPEGVPDTLDIRVRLWDDAGIGEAAVDTAGLADFVLNDIKGAVGDLVVTTMDVYTVAPYGAVTDTIDTYGAGFTQFDGVNNLGIADAVEKKPAGSGIFTATGLQPVMYGPFYTPGGGTNVPLRDAGVLLGVGTVGSAGAPALPVGITWSGAAPVYDPDTKIASGEYTGTAGLLDANTFGAISFSVLPNAAGTRFTTGPMDPNVFKALTVKAVVVQTTTGSGNDGGAGASANATRVRVEVGDIVLGGNYAGGQNVTLQVSEKDTSVTMAADQTFGGEDNPVTGVPGGLDIRKDNDGYQVVDVDAALVTVYTPDPAQTQLNIQGMLGDASDGLYSSQVDLANELLVVTIAGGDHVAIIATILGDATLDRVVNDDDYFTLAGNWFQSGNWTQGDFTGDGLVNDDDYFTLAGNWFQSMTITAPAVEGSGAVPEPATLSLLGLGLLGVLRRRRK